MSHATIDKQIVQGYSKALLIDLNKFSFTSIWKSEGSSFIKTQEEQTDYAEIIYNSSRKYHWDSSSYITNAIIEISEKNGLIEEARLDALFKNLKVLLCKHIVVRFTSFFAVEHLSRFFNMIKHDNIHSIIALFDYNAAYHSDEFGDLTLDHHNLKTVIVFDSPFDKNYGDTIYFFKKKYSLQFDKKISEFKIHHELYSESFLHHSYFNRKLFISALGEIKNAPEADEVFGQIEELNDLKKLKKIISTPHFQKYWSVHKDIMDVCKDCEFRYLCVDNRIPIQRDTDNWYHQKECNYNPYINKWRGERGYLTLHQCGIVSDQQGFMIDHDKVKKINDASLISSHR